MKICEEETFDHFDNKCLCLRKARQDHFGLNKIEQSHGRTIWGILEYSRIKVRGLPLRGEDSSDFSTDYQGKEIIRFFTSFPPGLFGDPTNKQNTTKLRAIQ